MGNCKKIFKTTIKSTLTITPADKNLGIVIMDKDDYMKQCMTLLADTNTYRRRIEYPTKDISNLLTRSNSDSNTHFITTTLLPTKQQTLPDT